ncbi:hypothetical protein EAG_04096 [Camponotus floridanus]|uniref:Uncharacterized protein n=1 Tax=Camponotus floridanus TaxID=104421 RepID=E1ZV98_CAMFO|nr:hypothetical protein EAG_04096 [Camponotus floridanus]
MCDKPTPGFAVESRDGDRGNLRKKAHQIANLIREYMEVLQSPPEIPRRDSTMTVQQFAAQQHQQQHQQPPATLPSSTTGGRKSRPASMLHRGAPVIQSQANATLEKTITTKLKPKVKAPIAKKQKEVEDGIVSGENPPRRTTRRKKTIKENDEENISPAETRVRSMNKLRKSINAEREVIGEAIDEVEKKNDH